MAMVVLVMCRMTLILTSLLFTLLYQVHPANRTPARFSICFFSLTSHRAIIDVSGLVLYGCRGLSFMAMVVHVMAG